MQEINFETKEYMGMEFLLGRKYLEEKKDLDLISSDIEKESEGSDFPYLLEVFPTKDSDFDFKIFVLIYGKEYLIINLKDYLKSLNTENLYSILYAFVTFNHNHTLNEELIDSVVKNLIESKKSITTMESCTSGMVANLITNTEGASSILKGAYVTYSNEAKVMAGVDKDLIDTYGVYSAEVASAMAKACKNSFGAEIGIGVTGTTGNVDPANSDSIQGEIYFMINSNEGKADCKLRLDTTDFSRKEIKEIICGFIFRVLELLEK